MAEEEEDDSMFGSGDEANEWDNYSSEDIQKEKQDVEIGRESYSKIVIDLYKTKMHGAMVGVRQKDQYMSKSRQFTKNTEVVGEIKYYYGFDDERERENFSEVVTFNKYFWDTSSKSPLYQKAEKEYKDYPPGEYAKLMRKIIIKTFIGLDKKVEDNQGRWTGSIEESQMISLALTFGEKDPLPFFFINIPGYKYRIPIFRTHAVTGERYVFTVVNPTTYEVMPFYIEGKRFTPGSDYTVINPCTMEKVAWIDDRATNIGGKVDITFYPEFEELNSNRIFRRVLILFSALSKYLAEVNISYKMAHRALTKQKDYKKDLNKADDEEKEKVEMKYKQLMAKMKLLKAYITSPHEMSLHYNPRRVRT